MKSQLSSPLRSAYVQREEAVSFVVCLSVDVFVFLRRCRTVPYSEPGCTYIGRYSCVFVCRSAQDVGAGVVQEAIIILGMYLAYYRCCCVFFSATNRYQIFVACRNEGFPGGRGVLVCLKRLGIGVILFSEAQRVAVVALGPVPVFASPGAC